MSQAQREPIVLIVPICVLILMMPLRASAADPPAAPPATPTPAAQTPDDASVPLGMIMGRNGGSLMRAETAQREAVEAEAGPGATPGDESKNDAPAGSVAAVSFFSVAPPKPKTYKKHDLITVIALEDSTFSSNGTTSETKTTDFDSQLNAFIAFRPSHLQLHSVISGGSNVPEIQTTNSRDYKGTGEVDRTDTLTDRFTAEVVDVKPNGTLILQAIKQIKTDEEEQRMILTGICRAEDVTADNSVLTTQLFDLELQTNHNGAVTDGTRRGFLPRLLDTFSPF
jgi:flagellar L-ring protein precursor FlgH